MSLEKVLFNNKKTVPQCDNETLGSTTETLVIQFDQERFEQILSEGGSNSTSAYKHKKISVARSPLATAQKQVSDKTKTVTCGPDSVSIETKVASR